VEHDAVVAEDAEAARAKRRGPSGCRPPEPLSAEDQAALDEHNKAVAEAAERLAAYARARRPKSQERPSRRADEALVASPPPRPDPTIRRPFGRKGEPTPAEIEQIQKRDAKKADDERIAKEKAEPMRQGRRRQNHQLVAAYPPREDLGRSFGGAFFFGALRVGPQDNGRAWQHSNGRSGNLKSSTPRSRRPATISSTNADDGSVEWTACSPAYERALAYVSPKPSMVG
jgi:hypothetical protein